MCKYIFRCNFCRDSFWWYWFHLFSNSLNVYYLNWLITCNNFTQKMYTFRRKKPLLKGKNLFKQIKILILLLMWTKHKEYHKLQLSTVVRYQHNNKLCKISSNYRYRKNSQKYRDIFFFISHTPIWKQFLVVFGGIFTAGSLTSFDLNSYCKALCDSLYVWRTI